MCSRPADGIHNTLIVIIGVAGVARIPDHFLAEYRFAVDNRASLAVACTQVEAYAVTIQMAAERYGNFFGLRNRLGTRHKHFKWALVDRAHEFVIEFACTCGRVDRLNVVADLGRASPTLRERWRSVAVRWPADGVRTEVQNVEMEPSPRSSASRSGTPPEAETSARYSRVNNEAGRKPGSSGAMTAGLTSIPATRRLIVLSYIYCACAPAISLRDPGQFAWNLYKHKKQPSAPTRVGKPRRYHF